MYTIFKTLRWVITCLLNRSLKYNTLQSLFWIRFVMSWVCCKETTPNIKAILNGIKACIACKWRRPTPKVIETSHGRRDIMHSSQLSPNSKFPSLHRRRQIKQNADTIISLFIYFYCPVLSIVVLLIPPWEFDL